MGLPARLQPARTLATGTVVRRGSLLALLGFCERLLTPAAAWVLFAQPLGVKLVVSLALGSVFTVRTYLVRSFAARTEADLTNRAIASVLDGAVLHASVLSDEDARAELGKGVYFSALYLSEVLPALVADLVAAALLTVVVFAMEPLPLVVAATTLMGIAAILLMWSRGRIQKAAQGAWALHEKLQDVMVDAIEGRLEIVASGERASFKTQAQRRARDWGAAGVRMASSALISGRLPLLAIGCAIAVVISADSSLLGGFSVSIADLALLVSVTPAFAGVGQATLAVAQSAPWVRAVARVIEGARPTHGTGAAPAGLMPIAFEALSFRYQGSATDALSSIDFTWQDERVIALLGANGSGKSTWLRVLLGLGAPRAGKASIGGVDLSSLDADAWRRQIAFLSQRPYLAPRADIRTTIRLLAPDASDARIQGALERVGLMHSLRRASPDPLGVVVDSLSVGQRQRIAIARVLCRDASLFVLDEPDANLDRAGVALIVDLVRSLSAEHRVLIAAHTSDLIAVADRVIELDSGRVVRDERRSAVAT